jgi:hypothetical protein
MSVSKLVAADTNLTQICAEPLPDVTFDRRCTRLNTACTASNSSGDLACHGKLVPGGMLVSAENRESAVARKKPTVEEIIGRLLGYRTMHGGLPAQRNVQLLSAGQRVSNYHLLRTIRCVRARTANICYPLHAEDRLGRGLESCTRICYAGREADDPLLFSTRR